MKQIFKTTLLLGVLMAMFLGVGYFLGGKSGMTTALFMAVIFNFGIYWFSDTVVLKMQRAKPLDATKHKNIVKIVEHLAKVNNIPMPKLYIVESDIPNAFATGRSPSHSAVAVTTGIMQMLNDKELEAVLAHELGHVKNRDMLVATVAATIAGALTYLGHMFMYFGNDDRSNPISSLALFILAPLAAALIQMAISRSREFLADEHSFETTGSGEHLASALEKLEGFKASHAKLKPNSAEQATAHLMFFNPFSAGTMAQLFSTHPSVESRVSHLKEIDPNF